MKFIKGNNLFKVTYEGKEGYVITDNTPKNKSCFCYNPLKITWENDIVLYQGVMPEYNYNGLLKIIASTFPLGDLPQFVIDKIDENIQERNYYKQVLNPVSSWELESQTWEKGFIDGWNKHAEKYKFTEECIVKCYEGLLQNVGTSVKISDLPTAEEYLKYLKQPKEITEIEFEVEQLPNFERSMGSIQENYKYQLKIIKSKENPNGLLTIKDINYA